MVFEIYISWMLMAGNVEKVFKRTARRENPTWSPDGKQIAYERGGVIYIATIGKQMEELVADGFDPAWSPDGREIALTLNPFGSHRLVLLNIHTRRQRQVLPARGLSMASKSGMDSYGRQTLFFLE